MHDIVKEIKPEVRHMKLNRITTLYISGPIGLINTREDKIFFNELPVYIKMNLKESAPQEWLTMSGILAGFTFAALVLIIQSKEKFVTPISFTFIFHYPMTDYSEVLITGLALDSVLFIFMTICVTLSPYSQRLAFLFGAGLGLLLFIIPGIIIPFSGIGAILVASTEVCLFVLYIVRAPSWEKKR
jgi:hypothetical protein